MPILKGALSPTVTPGPAAAGVTAAPVSAAAGVLTATLTGRQGAVATVTVPGVTATPATVSAAANNTAARLHACARPVPGGFTLALADPPAATGMSAAWAYHMVLP